MMEELKQRIHEYQPHHTNSFIGNDTPDEAPFAYRPVDEIASRIVDTVEIQQILKPVYTYMVGGNE